MLNNLKSIVKSNFEHFTYFYLQIRYKIFVALGLSIVVGTLDGFGLAMFLPLLKMVEGTSQASAEELGNLAFIINGLKIVGLELNLNTILCTMLFFFILKGLAKFCETYYKVLTQQYFIKKLRIDNLEKLSNFKYKAFVTADVGRIQNTLTGETERVVSAYKFYFMTMQAAVMLLVYIVLAFLANPQFAILVSIGGGISNLAFKHIYKRTKSISRHITKDSHGYQGLLIQSVSFFKYLKATALNKMYTQKLKGAVIEIEKNNRKIGYYGALLGSVREPMVVLVVVAVIFVQITYFGSNLSVIILSLLFFYRSLTYLMILQTQWNNFLNVSGSLENMTSFQQELNKEQDKHGNQRVEHFKNSIILKNVSFGYDNNAILDKVNLTIDKNKTYAFVGESGSGKTTLINLIAGLIQPKSGSVLIDESNILNLNTASFQSRIGYITQEPVIFNDTVYNNVTFWAEPTTENISRFWLALEKAAIAAFVLELPKKEKEILGSNGVNISGGQKQRISIARELYKEIDILIMDEATSALDSETEKAIQSNIDKLRGQYTILIIAHRLSTIRNVDEIVMMHNGKVTGIGDFNQLIHTSKGFKKMVELQGM